MCPHLFIDAVGKAFLAGTILVFGGATAVLLYTADKLQLHSVSHAIGSSLNNIESKCTSYLQEKGKIICIRFVNRKYRWLASACSSHILFEIYGLYQSSTISLVFLLTDFHGLTKIKVLVCCYCS
jgi:hypothetical protein